MLVPITRA